MQTIQTNDQLPALQLLTAADVARVLSISRRYAYQLMESGQIPCVWIGRSIRVLPADLDAYIDSLPRTCA